MEKDFPVPWRTWGERGSACALGAGGCFACCARTTCCSGASHALCPCRSLHDCPPHRPCQNWGPVWVFPKNPAYGSDCGSPSNARHRSCGEVEFFLTCFLFHCYVKTVSFAYDTPFSPPSYTHQARHLGSTFASTGASERHGKQVKMEFHCIGGLFPEMLHKCKRTFNCLVCI